MTQELPVAELAAALASALLGLDDGAPLIVVVQLPDGRTASVVEVLYRPAEGVLELRTDRGTDRPQYRSPTGRALREYDHFRSDYARRHHEDLLERELRDWRPRRVSVQFPLDEEVKRLFYGSPSPTSADPLRDVRAEPTPPPTEPEPPS